MTIRNLTLATLLALSAAAFTAQAAPAVSASLDVTMLDAVVVTPTARYSTSEWQMRQASRKAVVLDTVIVTPTARYSLAEWQSKQAATHTLAAVMLAPVIVTPKRSYTLTEWQQHQAGLVYARQDGRRRVRGWLNAVWKHFQFARTPVEV